MVTSIRLTAGHKTRLFRRWLWSLRCAGGYFRRQNRSAKSDIGFRGKTNLPSLCSQLELVNCHAGQVERRSINSCLCPVGSIDGCVITTSEGIGSSKKGFSQIQGPNPPLHLHACFQHNLLNWTSAPASGCIYCAIAWLQIALQNIAPRNVASALLVLLLPPIKP